MNAVERLALCAALVVAASSCGAAENAAARDPMRCERDPSCAKGRGSYIDCTRQCADNPECMDRCKGVQVDRAPGHP